MGVSPKYLLPRMDPSRERFTPCENEGFRGLDENQRGYHTIALKKAILEAFSLGVRASQEHPAKALKNEAR